MIGKLMMATQAHSDPNKPNVIDLSREEPDLMRVDGEDGDYWVGHWIEGLGFINVHFPKSTTRPCTQEEKEYYCHLTVASTFMDSFKLKPEDFA